MLFHFEEIVRLSNLFKWTLRYCWQLLFINKMLKFYWLDNKSWHTWFRILFERRDLSSFGGIQVSLFWDFLFLNWFCKSTFDLVLLCGLVTCRILTSIMILHWSLFVSTLWCSLMVCLCILFWGEGNVGHFFFLKLKRKRSTLPSRLFLPQKVKLINNELWWDPALIFDQWEWDIVSRNEGLKFARSCVDWFCPFGAFIFEIFFVVIWKWKLKIYQWNCSKRNILAIFRDSLPVVCAYYLL